MSTPRVGVGFDVHPFSDDPHRRLVLGGVELPGPGLAGHSDADALAHAVGDALLGATALGDIGTMFPDTDSAHEGADSMALLGQVVKAVKSEGFEIGNVDVSVVMESPRLAPAREEIERNLQRVLGAPVNVKPKRAEGLGAMGRREGVACFAVALVVSK